MDNFGCPCSASDAWRCAVQRNLGRLACGCPCHRDTRRQVTDNRPIGECYNCRGQGMVFPGFEGRPLWGPDTSRIITCPVCNGTGKVRGGQMPLF